MREAVSQNVSVDSFNATVAGLTRSRFAGFKDGTFTLATEDGNKVVHATVWRQGLARRITLADIEIIGTTPNPDEEGHGAYPYLHLNTGRTEESMRSLSSSLTPVNDGQGSRRALQEGPGGEYSLEATAREIGKLAGKDITHDAILDEASALLRAIDRRKDRIKGDRFDHIK